MNPRVTTALVAASLVLVVAAWTVDPQGGAGAWVWIALIVTMAALLTHLTRPRVDELAPYRYPGGDR